MHFIKSTSTVPLLTLALGLALNGYSQSFLTNGLVAYYPFNGNANDASGNGTDGTVYGATLTTNRFGNSNAAYYFGGAAYITAPLGNNAFGGDFTVSVWYNPYDLANGWLTLLDAEDNDGNYAFTMSIAGQASGANIGWLGAGSTYAPASGCWNVNSGGAVPVSAYSHAVITKAGTTVTMYLNGHATSTGSVTHASPTSGQFITIGRSDVGFWSSAWTFHGVLDDVRIFNRALSPTEVSQLYAIESVPAAVMAPAISVQPQPVTINAYSNASFSITATGTAPLGYQWSFNGTNLAQATASALTITNATESDLGLYAVVVTNAFGSITSSNALLSMYPYLETPFAGAVTYWGKDATLSVRAWGTEPLTYQWYDNGVAVAGATNATLKLTGIQFTNAGVYFVAVSNPLGSVTNPPAQVVVNPAGVSLGMYPGVTVSGVVGYTYNIQSNTDLTNTNGWNTAATLTLMLPVQLWVDTTDNAASPTNAHRFYRVVPGP